MNDIHEMSLNKGLCFVKIHALSLRTCRETRKLRLMRVESDQKSGVNLLCWSPCVICPDGGFRWKYALCSMFARGLLNAHNLWYNIICLGAYMVSTGIMEAG